jgi:hypothetical protein
LTQQQTGQAARIAPDLVSGLALAVFGGLAMWQASRLPLGSIASPGAGYVPLLLGLLLTVFGLAIALLGRRAPAERMEWLEGNHALHIIGTCVFAALAIEDLGYRLTIAAILVYLLGVVERQRPLVVLGVTAALSLGTYFVFAGLLQVQLPLGPWGF